MGEETFKSGNAPVTYDAYGRLDLEPLRQRLGIRGSVDHDTFVQVQFGELAALVAEVQRLRGENSH